MEDMEGDEKPFRLFSGKFKPSQQTVAPTSNPLAATTKKTHTDNGDPDADASGAVGFSELGLSEWAVDTCRELGIRSPTPVQRRCIPRILAGDDVLGIAQTGSGKTAAFALPILQRLATEPYGVFALVITPTRELACQLADQFRALGSTLHLRCTLIIGGMNMMGQAQALMQRPHIVVATPGRIKVLLSEDPDISAAFSKVKCHLPVYLGSVAGKRGKSLGIQGMSTWAAGGEPLDAEWIHRQFLVLDEADRVLDVGFEEELRIIFKSLPKSRQTLLFSATMTSQLQALLELSANRSYFFEAYEGFKTVESLKQQYIFIPKNVKEVYLFHILSKMEDMSVRSAMIFVSTCRSCHLLSLLLEELDEPAVALHSHKSQALRLAALNKFKSGRVPILLATDVASRGLDIPTVDLVINYDIPRYPRDYVHRVGRTARAGRGGMSISFITQNDIDLIHEIENDVGKKMDAFECKEQEVLENITKVYKARRVARMKMMDDGFEEKAQERKAQKMKALAGKGLLKKMKRKHK